MWFKQNKIINAKTILDFKPSKQWINNVYISNYYIWFVCNWHYISTFTLHVHSYLKLNKWLYDAKRHKGLTVYTQSHWILPLCYLWLRPNCTLIYTTRSCNQPKVFSLVKKKLCSKQGSLSFVKLKSLSLFWKHVPILIGKLQENSETGSN